MKWLKHLKLIFIALTGFIFCAPPLAARQHDKHQPKGIVRERISIDQTWLFYKYDSAASADHLIYDGRPEVRDNKDNKAADSKPTEAVKVETTQDVLKPWILPGHPAEGSFHPG